MRKKNSNHGFAKLLALLIILAFVYVTNSNQDTKVPDRPLTADQKKELQKQQDRKTGRVRTAHQIPDKVYEDTTSSDKFANILNSNRKVIYYAYLINDSDANVFLDEFGKLLKSHAELQSYYFYYPDPMEQFSSVYCNKVGSSDCIQNFLVKNCHNNMCIVNPYKKQILKISSKNFRQAFDSVYSHKNW